MKNNTSSHLAAVGFFATAVFACAVVTAHPGTLYAAVVISELMYDVPSEQGAEDKREWVEIHNTGSEAVDLTGWKIHDGNNHVLNVPPKNGGQGNMTLGPNEYAVLADDATTFLTIYSVATVIDTSLSLNNTTDTISLISKDGTMVDSVTYEKSDGAAGDGNSLQVNGTLGPAIPTPGKANRTDAFVEAAPENTDEKKVTVAETSDDVSEEKSADNIADAGDDRAALVGVDVVFDVPAIPNAAYVWNFGDGTTAAGSRATHRFDHSGRYTVVLEVSVGGRVQSDSAMVTVSGVDMALRLLPDGIELRNNGRTEVVISGWKLLMGGKEFTIPPATRIAGGGMTVFAASVTGLSTEGGTAQLRTPSGTVAAEAIVLPVEEDLPVPAEEEKPKADTPAHEGRIMRADDSAADADADDVVAVVEETGPNADTSQLAAAVSDSGSMSIVWFGGLLGLIGLGAVGMLFSRAKPAPRTARFREEAYEIVETDEK